MRSTTRPAPHSHRLAQNRTRHIQADSGVTPPKAAQTPPIFACRGRCRFGNRVQDSLARTSLTLAIVHGYPARPIGKLVLPEWRSPDASQFRAKPADRSFRFSGSASVPDADVGGPPTSPEFPAGRRKQPARRRRSPRRSDPKVQLLRGAGAPPITPPLRGRNRRRTGWASRGLRARR